VDQSEGFLKRARANVPDRRAHFQIQNAEALTIGSATCDVVVSGLLLNFIPARDQALSEMKRVARVGGTVAFYVWDYPGRGVEFMRAFWDAATSLDANARDLTEDRRFPYCTPDQLTALSKRAGLVSVECAPIEVPTVFESFADYWTPFTLGTGPAPGYCASLDAKSQQRLKDKLQETLPRRDDGTIPLKARAWAIKSLVC
jgi:SAM-dependent methyltransferase